VEQEIGFDDKVLRLGPLPAIDSLLPTGTRASWIAQSGERVASQFWPSNYDFKAPHSPESKELRWLATPAKAPLPRHPIVQIPPGRPGIRYMSERKLQALGVSAAETADLNARKQRQRYIEIVEASGQLQSLHKVVSAGGDSSHDKIVNEMGVLLRVGKMSFDNSDVNYEEIGVRDSVVFATAESSSWPDASVYLFGSADNWTAGEPLLDVRSPPTSGSGYLTALIADVLGAGPYSQPTGSPDERLKFLKDMLKIDRYEIQYIYQNVDLLFEVDTLVLDDHIGPQHFRAIGRLVCATVDS